MTDRDSLDYSDPQQRPRYTGLASFFRLPYREDFEADPPEIGIIGVPFDGGVTNRPGTRYGPREVRNQSSLVRRVNQATGASPFEAARVADLGDAWVRNPYELKGALDEIEAFYARVHAAGIRPLTCGGDHAITAPILRAIAGNTPLALIHIDAHCDTGKGYLGSEYHHGTPFKLAADAGAIDPKLCVQIGIRGSVFSMENAQFSYDSGMRVMRIEEVEERGWRACIDEAIGIVGDRPCYVSFDIDSLDPVWAPGTGTPEAGGLTMREAQGMVRRLAGLDIRGADMVEVSPPYDVGGITSFNGATILFELLCVMAGARG
ncbi:MAG TPA: agmatinase [Thermohalobaculum sp.]|nr:agmatinase [Thermohalobaculum sp.]